MHSLGKGGIRKDEVLIGRLNSKEAGEAMAMSTGPGLRQLEETTQDLSKYGETVRRRAHDRGMSEKVKIYRDNLFGGKWEKSLETTAGLFEIASAIESRRHSSTSSAARMGGQSDGCYLGAMTTFLLGDRDPAFDRRLTLDNFKDTLVGGGQVVLVKDAGHWLPLESGSRRILEKTVAWALSVDVDKEPVSAPFADMSGVKVIVEV